MYASAKWGARSIVATHLLESMIDNPTPTRAEVTDVANAIYEGADAIMLSGETSIGKYPIQCVQMLKEISERTEEYKTLGYEEHLLAETDWQNIAIAAKNLAEGIQADGIIAITRSGRTANVIANTKPTNLTVFCFTNNKATYQQLSIMGSMHGFYIKNLANQSVALKKIQSTIKKLVKLEKREYKFILISGIYSEQYTDSIQVIKF
jgi:pyruvate kinase